MSKLADKMRKIKERQAKRGGSSTGSYADIYHRFQEGDNNLRFCGDFVEVKTHFIAPGHQGKGLCPAESFRGENRIPQVVNCLDWDIANETEKEDKVCPVCRINKIAYGLLDEGGEDLDQESEKWLKDLASATRARSQMKWNVIDRDEPFITSVKDGGNEKIKGYKIASLGIEAFLDIQRIVEDTGLDISDPEEGIDVVVTKKKSNRWEYSANAAMDKGKRPPQVKMTPLTDEERSMELHRLVERCGWQTEEQKIIDNLNDEVRELLDMNDDDDDDWEGDGVTSDAINDTLNEIIDDDDYDDDEGPLPLVEEPEPEQKKTRGRPRRRARS